ncbi:MAG: hypothetical protein ACR2O4_02700 [Hyphomicrobiaceae bacterium]
MGCDIHFHVERRHDGQWISCDQWEEVTDGDYRGLYSLVRSRTDFYDDRNYDLFAILANVRNGFGTAGLDTGDGFNVIAKPKGLPADMSPEVFETADWEVDHMGCHSASWLTLAEILAFDWDQTTVKRGFVNGAEYEEWVRSRRKKGQGPSGHAAGVGSTKRLSEEEMQKTTDAIKGDDPAEVWMPKIAEELEDTYCYVTWEVSYCERAGWFLTETVPKMQKLGDPEDVRCVFWFDN